MSLVDGVGAGLIAGGAVALLPTLLAPTPPAPGEIVLHDGMQDHRRARTVRTCAQVSAVATLAGAALLLVSTHRWVALIAGGAVVCAAWLLLARRVSAQYAQLADYVEGFRGRGKGLPPDVAAALGLALLVPGGSPLPVGADIDDAVSIAEERAQFRRALRHPFGYRDGL